MARIAIYSRVSTSSQQTENQIRELRAWAERAGHEIVAEFEDKGISGTKGRDQRSGFDKLLKDAVRRRFALVAVWSVDRLGRSMIDLLAALQELRAAGVDLYVHTQAVDTSTPTGKMLFSVLGTIAEFERELIVARVNAGLDRAKAQGTKLGRPRVAEDVQAQVRDLLAQGVGKVKIGKQLGIGTNAVQRIVKAMQEEAKENEAKAA